MVFIEVSKNFDKSYIPSTIAKNIFSKIKYHNRKQID